ncbi:MAG: hypothetical protein LBI12_00870 [Treponema sp.]|jgi:hypothetical protein|nr:hypothetical protein [Treponema sp.]
MRFLYFLLMPFFFTLVFSSCVDEKQVKFTVSGTEVFLFAKGRAAQEGTLDFSKQEKFEYRFSDIFAVPHNSSLNVEYTIDFPSRAENKNYSFVLDTGQASWHLPADFDGHCVYSIPVDNSFDGRFRIFFASDEKIGKKSMPELKIHSVNVAARFYGFYDGPETNFSSKRIFKISPFVYRYSADASYVIDVPASFLPNPSYAGIEAAFSSGGVLEFAGRRFETLSGTENIFISPALRTAEGKAVFSGEGVTVFSLNIEQSSPVFPEPIIADPALVIAWPRESWRSSRYEVFKWDRFSSAPVLIFDYADYAVQDRMLKRLAFFVEKAGFRGQLSQDTEIEHLHGWNAHNYRAQDLARFFDLARRTNFPLLNEERELENILLNEGIIRAERNGSLSEISIVAGNGAIISITRESPDYLRYRFMAHEGFHGIFFIDEEFRDFSWQRWERLPATAKRFITSYFDFQQYDTKDEYLLVNEFMGHILQQPVSQAADYFGRNLPLRLENTWRVSSLPQKDTVTGTWPDLADAFTEEAQAFSDYVNRRWGFTAGRVWGLRVR